MRRMIRFFAAPLIASTCVIALAQSASDSKGAPHKPAAKASPQVATDPGERVFAAQCSRCHNAPEQLNPRITGTVARHMRVRANLSEADERAIMRFFNP